MMSTLPADDFLKMNLSLLILMIIYGGIQLTRRMKASTLLVLSTPFMTYLWLIYFYHNIYYILVISALFYLLITHKEYVRMCKETQSVSSDAGMITNVAVRQGQQA